MSIDCAGTVIFLKEFEPLIHKTLQRLNIPQRHVDYEDFFQELQIHLLKILKKFKSDTTDVEITRYKFVSYAGQGLYWHGINLLRKKDLHSFQNDESDYLDSLEDRDVTTADSIESTLHAEEFFELAKKRLSNKEYLFLIKLAEGKHTMQELAVAYGVSRTTIYQWKEKIQFRLEDIKDCLKD